MNNSYRNFFIVFIFLTLILGAGCSSSKKTARNKTTSFGTDTARVVNEHLTDLQRMLKNNRSKLSDVYATQRQDMPKAFLKKSSTDEAINSDPFDGYRIQIISTKNMQLADSVADQFRVWSDTTITGYSAKAYVFFKQPFYKVHVGDFHNREHAYDFTKLIKRKYPEAWVVHDRINPSDVPSDSSSFSIIKPGERKKTKVDSLNNHSHSPGN